MREGSDSTARGVLVVGGLGLVAHGLVVGQVQDDAFFSLRMALHALHGHGLVWNVGERVLAVTHPLWMLLQVPLLAVLRHPVAVLLVQSLGAVVALVAVAGRVAPGAWARCLLLGVFATSQAVYGWLFSGLENPLTFALALGLVAVGTRDDPAPRTTRDVWLLASLLLLTRYDAVILAGPLALARLARGRSLDHARAALVGLAPALAWLAAATVYYGHPLPNTALAKAFDHVPTAVKLGQGLGYLGLTVLHDPVAVGAAAVGTWRGLRHAPWAAALVVGAWLDLAYVAIVGGDYLLGRFVGPAMVVLAGVAVAPGVAPGRGRPMAIALAVLAMAGVGARRALHPSHPEGTSARVPHVVVDLSTARTPWTNWDVGEYRPDGPDEVVVGRVGRGAYGEGPGTYAVTPWALADPLLARLPVVRWAPGHGVRRFPRGYVAFLEGDAAALVDPGVRRLAQDLALVHRGPVWSRDRWAAMVRVWRGAEAYLDVDAYADPWPARRGPLPDEARGDPFDITGIVVRAGAPFGAPGVDLALSGHGYTVTCVPDPEDGGAARPLARVAAAEGVVGLRDVAVGIPEGLSCAGIGVHGELVSDHAFRLGRVARRAAGP